MPSNEPSRVVDPTLLLAEELPCWWPTRMPFQQKTFSYVDERGDAACRAVNRSGWDRHYVRADAGSAYCFDPLVLKSSPGWPAPEPPAMRLLIERGVRCVGEGLGAGVVFVEALAGLEQLPPRGAFSVFAPIHLARATGAPGRAMAWLPTEEDPDGH